MNLLIAIFNIRYMMNYRYIVQIAEVTNFKRDEAIDGLCHRFGLSEAARCRLVELRVRRGGAAEDYRRLTEHLELSADASWTAVSLIKKAGSL